ncbi:M48 family metalloprotease [Legionella gresilensis]|uniref:M48 family metalloprotease n=1 Tax=Legionella gresilensis TaxID=91823 RepID=UPI0010416A27|nr:M48 family metalloprotease [Legionella gresilensis]
MKIINRISKKLRTIKTLLLIVSLQLSTYSSYALTPYSNKQLEELEKEFIQKINQSDSIVRNPLANQYINHLGKQLAKFDQSSAPYFFIVKSDEINAFAGPGGYIGINSQLILATDNEGELAGVMAHELAHVRLHHLYRLLEHEKQMRIPLLASLLASVALGAVNPTLGSGALMASMSGFAQDNINFIRANEKEADRIGIKMLLGSGLNPHGMADFFRKLQQHTRYFYTANLPAILRTHPLDDDRIAEAENRTNHIKSKNYTDTLDYHLFKELIRTIVAQNPQHLLNYYQHECRRHSSNVACQYGHAVTYLRMDNYKQAQARLTQLLNVDGNNLFYQIAMAQAEAGNKQFIAALKRLQELQLNYPENYAVLMAYAQTLRQAGQPKDAVTILLKGFRQFQNNLPLCEELAQAQAAAQQKGYAYFTEARCHLLQGRQRDALRQLRLARALAKKDQYLIARAEALIEDIKYMTKQ